MWLANVAREFVSNILSAASYGRTPGWVAWGFIAFFGAIAALAQVGVATFVLGPVLNAVLFSLAGIAIVGVGGGLIQPMRSRWERMLTKAEEETTRVGVGAAERAGLPEGPRGRSRRTAHRHADVHALRPRIRGPPRSALAAQRSDGDSDGGGAGPERSGPAPSVDAVRGAQPSKQRTKGCPAGSSSTRTFVLRLMRASTRPTRQPRRPRRPESPTWKSKCIIGRCCPRVGGHVGGAGSRRACWKTM